MERDSIWLAHAVFLLALSTACTSGACWSGSGEEAITALHCCRHTRQKRFRRISCPEWTVCVENSFLDARLTRWTFPHGAEGSETLETDTFVYEFRLLVNYFAALFDMLLFLFILLMRPHPNLSSLLGPTVVPAVAHSGSGAPPPACPQSFGRDLCSNSITVEPLLC